MAEPSCEKEIGINREGLVVKGSRMAPLLLLGVAMLVFLATGIHWKNAELIDFPQGPPVTAEEGDVKGEDVDVSKDQLQKLIKLILALLFKEIPQAIGVLKVGKVSHR